MDREMLKTDLVWTPDWTQNDELEPMTVYFRRSFFLEEVRADQHFISISADSRYKLYVNGSFVQEGPQKAISLSEWFRDRADISSFLREGENVIAAEVRRYPAARPGVLNFNASLLRTETPMFYLKDETPVKESISARNGWKCWIDRGRRIVSEKPQSGPVSVQAPENILADWSLAWWKEPGYDDRSWQDVQVRTIMDGIFAAAPYKMRDRTIPPMRHELKRFVGVTAVRSGDAKHLIPAYEKMLLRDRPVCVPAHTEQIVEITAGEETCGYLLYAFEGGAGSAVSTLWSECYAYPKPDVPNGLGGTSSQPPEKGDRTDHVNGDLLGVTSTYHVSGYGTEERPEKYEPFWFSTFRFIRLAIRTEEEPLTIRSFRYRETGYPLDVKTAFDIPDPEIQQIWDISVRTLRRCMNETYMDCPFYEQLQYLMDSRSEILYTYAISADDRLARQAMEAFRLSQRPDGLLSSTAPSRYYGVIPGFSIYYILMLHDHMMYFGDRELVRRSLPCMDQILSFFGRHLNQEGLVERIGGMLLLHPFWSFIDWAEGWNGGIPPVSGNITMESLLYLYGLQKAAELADYAERMEAAAEYRSRAEQLSSAVLRTCSGIKTDADGSTVRLIQDSAGEEKYSVHCQAFAVLTGLVPAEEGANMLRFALENPDITKPSVAFQPYVFEALDQCGAYEMTKSLWNPWRKMLSNHLTTCVENDTDARSDCHAWGSLMCYELPAVLLGVRPAAPGCEKLYVRPRTDMIKAAAAKVITPKGAVSVQWEEGKAPEISGPTGVTIL